MPNLEKQLTEIVTRFTGTRIAVVGDLILDEFIWGDVQRISPEAPVPVVEVNRESLLPGGAANVAMNLASLGAEPLVVGLVGDDSAGRRLEDVLEQSGVTAGLLVRDPERLTTVKTRIIAHQQQVCRADRENREAPPPGILSRVRQQARRAIEQSQAVILSDYAKGVFIDSLARDLIHYSLDGGSFVAVDPKKDDFSAYSNASILTPNLKEAERACGFPISDPDSLRKAGIQLMASHGLANLLITMGEKGMALFQEGRFHLIETAAREVYDVTGAGDTVIAVLTLAVAAGADLNEAAHLANHAAGIVVGKVGTATPTPEELLANLH